jgi:hypothetical protein
MPHLLGKDVSQHAVEALKTRRRAASRRERGEANLRRGFLRIGTALMLLWFLFWTCAYVVSSRPSENAPSPPPLSPTTDLVLIAGAVLSVPWIVAGFRSN